MHRARIGRASLFSRLVLLCLCLCLAGRVASAQSEPRERQAAAEAYDQGTASYLSGDYPKAAEWFETANRLSPAAPALIQAARAHQQAGHLTRAATLALRLTLEYANEPAAVQYGNSVLQQLAARFVRVEVTCTGCTLDVDGTLQESQVFFVEPGVPHNVTASFETGERNRDVEGEAGTTRTLSFEAPPPPVVPDVGADAAAGGTQGRESDRKPFGPAVTLIAGGVTALLLAGSIVSGIDTKAGVDSYVDAASKHTFCSQSMGLDSPECRALYDVAKAKLDRGEAKETRTTVLWIATGAAGAATAVIALLFTDWSGSEEKASGHAMQVSVSATPYGAGVLMKGNL